MQGKNKAHGTRLERAGKRQAIYNIIYRLHTLDIANLELEAQRQEIPCEDVRGLVGELKQKGLVYSPKPGRLSCVDE
jgi:hypothetical protein